MAQFGVCYVLARVNVDSGRWMKKTRSAHGMAPCGRVRRARCFPYMLDKTRCGQIRALALDGTETVYVVGSGVC